MHIFKNIKSFKHALSFIALLFYIFPIWANCAQPVAAGAFDWDDNIMFMPTQVILFHKYSNQIQHISTGEFAKHNQDIGKQGFYIDYEIRKTELENSFKYFRDPESNIKNYFLHDVETTVSRKDNQWKGPSWERFIYALNDESAAKWTSIITARGHSPQSIYKALNYLKEQKIIKYLPNIENIHPVSHPNYVNLAPSPSEIKTKVMINMLDEISKCEIDSSQHHNHTHVWGFSDDDYNNYIHAKNNLSKEIANGRWHNIKVSLFYTGGLMTVSNKLPYKHNFVDNFKSSLSWFNHSQPFHH